MSKLEDLTHQIQQDYRDLSLVASVFHRYEESYGEIADDSPIWGLIEDAIKFAVHESSKEMVSNHD